MNEKPSSSIPEIPKHKKEHHMSSHHAETHQDHHKLHHIHHDSKPSKEIKEVLHYNAEIPQAFHEGHEKDVPDPNDFMKPEKFEDMKIIAEKHNLGENVEMKETGENKGLWEKTKETISDGVQYIKNIFNDKNKPN